MNIYVVTRNADLTEGRGPMVPVSAYTDRQKAIDSAMNQPGVMGRHNGCPGIDSGILVFGESGERESQIAFEYRWDKLTIREVDLKGNEVL